MPLDGLNYLGIYVSEPKEKEGEKKREYMNIKAALEERFGEIWIDNPEARAVLWALMVETGKDRDRNTYGKFVIEADIEAAKERLKSWGISEKDI